MSAGVYSVQRGNEQHEEESHSPRMAPRHAVTQMKVRDTHLRTLTTVSTVLMGTSRKSLLPPLTPAEV